MRASQLVQQSLAYYWRTNLAVVLGVATAVSVLAGALLVGDSVRSSLRDLVVQRLGQTSYVVSSTGFFREQLAADLLNDPQFVANGFSLTCPLISLEGTVTHESSKRVASRVSVYGVDDRFWKFNQVAHGAPENRNVYVSPTLARELASASGDSILVQVQKPSEIPLESLHSKKENVGKTLRLTVSEALSREGLGEFSIQPQQTGVRAIFLSLKLLQREIEQPDKANVILISASPNSSTAESLNETVHQRFTLADLGIKLRRVQQDKDDVIALEHDSKLIDDLLGRVAAETARRLGLRQATFFSYLANSLGGNSRSIPYSLVTAVDDEEFKVLSGNGSSSSSDAPPIVLNDWAANDLGVREGDQITLEYYLWQDSGSLTTKTATFRLIRVVPMSGLAADRNLVPEYPGISGSENLADWDPPFPVDLQRVRQKDEDYWHSFKTTPKAFIPLKVGQELWQSRFGNATSMRFWSGNSPVSFDSFAESLRAALNPQLMGLSVMPVRAEGIQASRGATDFGEYFLYFSFFLVVSALLLTTLFFKLGVEQRIREIGILRAVGYGPGKIRALFLGEGLIVAFTGSLLGLVGAIAYAQLMMFGLRTWWVDAVGTTSLDLHLSAQSLLIGAVSGNIAALACVALTLRNLQKRATRSLLAGQITSDLTKLKQPRWSFYLAILVAAIGTGLLVLAATHKIGQVPGFFGSGTLLLMALLLFQSAWLRRQRGKLLGGTGWRSVMRLGARNTSYRPARSILSIALIASAVFIIVAVDSFRHRAGLETHDRKSGTGGYPLLAESLLPLVKDPNSRDGQEDLNLRDDNPQSPLAAVTFTRFRVKPGDDTSCLNLYQPRSPKIIAPTNDFIKENRFAFQSAFTGSPQETSNPWLLLNHEFPDGAVPVIADANSLTYVLHSKVGDDLVIANGDHEQKLRVVAALSDSVFQSELLMSESNFTRLFPDQQGYRFFLIDVVPDRVGVATAALEDQLSDYGFDVQSTAERLASFHRVENTYLSTFQMLGGLGLVLGTIGLSAILLRNVLERRRELALMRAVGYNSQHFTLMIVAENAVLLIAGLVTGALCALLAIAPVLVTRHGAFSNPSLGILLFAVLASGLAASIVATWATLRAPLLAALRAE